MTIATCQHCDQQIFWFGRHSRWLHRVTQSRHCATLSRQEAEPVGAPTASGRQPLPA